MVASIVTMYIRVIHVSTKITDKYKQLTCPNTVSSIDSDDRYMLDVIVIVLQVLEDRVVRDSRNQPAISMKIKYKPR